MIDLLPERTLFLLRTSRLCKTETKVRVIVYVVNINYGIGCSYALLRVKIIVKQLEVKKARTLEDLTEGCSIRANEILNKVRYSQSASDNERGELCQCERYIIRTLKSTIYRLEQCVTVVHIYRHNI